MHGIRKRERGAHKNGKRDVSTETPVDTCNSSSPGSKIEPRAEKDTETSRRVHMHMSRLNPFYPAAIGTTLHVDLQACSGLFVSPEPFSTDTCDLVHRGLLLSTDTWEKVARPREIYPKCGASRKPRVPAQSQHAEIDQMLHKNTQRRPTLIVVCQQSGSPPSALRNHPPEPQDTQARCTWKATSRRCPPTDSQRPPKQGTRPVPSLTPARRDKRCDEARETPKKHKAPGTVAPRRVHTELTQRL